VRRRRGPSGRAAERPGEGTDRDWVWVDRGLNQGLGWAGRANGPSWTWAQEDLCGREVLL
jgi:hypothetical protein